MKPNLIPSKIKDYSQFGKVRLNLGAWCNIYDGKEKTLNENIVKHPWKNSYQFERDYTKISKIYEKCLRNISVILNSYFGKNYSIRFWRILIGAYLNLIITKVYEKEKLIFETNKIGNLCVKKFKYKVKSFVTNNYSEFLKISEEDEWNYYIFLRLLEGTKNKKIETIKSSFNLKPKPRAKKKKSNHLLSFVNFMSNNKIIFHNSRIDKYDKIYLGVKNFKFFGNYFPSFNSNSVINFKLRNFLFLKYSKEFNEHTNYIKLIIENLPLDFLEDFNAIGKKIKSIYLPDKPKIIYTSNLISQENVFVRYVSETLEKGTKLIYSQHGGNYGNLRKNWFEDHEIEVSDYYLTWGWKKKSKKVKNYGKNIISKKIIRKKFDPSKHNKVTIITNSSSHKYIIQLQSFRYNMQSYYDFFYKHLPTIIDNLSSNIKTEIVLRDYGNGNWNLNRFLENKYNFISFKNEVNTKAYESCLNQSRINIVTIFSTVFFECMKANIPTILVLPHFNKRSFNSKTMNILNVLKKNRIFFEDPKSAALFVNKNWEKINIWWANKKTQNSIKLFNMHFNKDNEHFALKLQKLINKIKKDGI